MKKQTNIEEHPTMKMNKRLTYIIFTSVLLLFGFTATAQVTVGGSVYGGGNEAMVGGSCSVLIDQDGALIETDVYGGGALAMVNTTDGTNPTSGKTTSVTLTQGTVNGSVYGGGLGKTTPENVPANVFGPVQVTVNGGSVEGSVFGCNNLNGTPKSTVEVVINGSDPTTGGGDDPKVYAIKGVYGGGNQAHYVPTSITKDYPLVTINGCNTSIENVFGGGKAAGVSQTNVIINGGDIGRAFAGGDGDNPSNTPAHVGYDNTEATPTTSNYPEPSDENGVGDANISVQGGTIGQVFGGSNKNGVIRDENTVDVAKTGDCAMKIKEVYGGGNMAAGNAGEITIGCTGTLKNNHFIYPDHIGDTLEGIGTVYGGANQADIANDITVNINNGIVNKVFGGNNQSGSVNGKIHVNINKTGSCDWYIGEVYGAGNVASYSDTTDVNIIAGTVYRNVYGGGNNITSDAQASPAGVLGSDVEMIGGTVLGGIYGGCNLKGTVINDSEVKIYGGAVGSAELLNATTPVVAQVFGGGLGEDTRVNGNVTVTVDKTDTNETNIYGDVYGGSALGQVNNAASDKTTVNVLDGVLHSEVKTVGGFPVYYGGNVFGGGLGKKAVPDDPDVEGDQSELAIEAKVYGTVTVNIGSCTPNGADPGEGDHTGNAYSGSATIQGNVYGCNNTYGSPQQNVTVNIYQTAHTQGVDEVGDPGYAIHNVFGGGNEADFRVNKTTTVNVFGCDNTIERTFGGGNAAATNSVITDIKGGRIHDVFGGGNGEVSAADIYGDITLGIHGGTIGQSYSISNQNGVVTGGASVVIDNAGCGGVQVEDHFMGGNFATVYGELNNVITCEGGMVVKNLYGGCKQADVLKYPSVEDVVYHHDDGTYPDYVIELYDANPATYASTYAEKFGNVHLTVNGGTYENVYGGSQGTPERGANIEGDVQLDIYGGTITKAIFGGSHIKGSIGGKIIVNVEDKYPYDACALDVSIADVYGGGNQANYPGEGITHDGEYNYPQVNIKNATVKNVFGGALEAEVTGNPQIQLKNKATILGNVYGGGNRGVVNGNPKVILNGKQTN